MLKILNMKLFNCSTVLKVVVFNIHEYDWLYGYLVESFSHPKMLKGEGRLCVLCAQKAYESSTRINKLNE